MEKRDFDLFELLRIILQNRVFIAIFVLVVSIGAVIYSLVTPQIWESRASFYVVGDKLGGLSIDIPGMSSLTSQLLGSDSSQQSVNAVSVLLSRRFSEEVIRKFDLIRYFKISKPDSLWQMDMALKKLRNEMVNIGYNADTGLVVVSVDSKDKILSRDMVNFYLQKLDVYNREQKVTKGRMNREFLQNRVEETRGLIDSLLIAVKDFQQSNNAIDIETQVAALIGSYSEVIASKMQADIELELARKNYAENSPIVGELKTRRDALARQIKELEAGSSGLKPRYLIDISRLPDLQTQYAQLKMNLEIQSKVYEYLYPQYEATRLEELRDMPSIDVLDSPREAGVRVRPKRAVFCLIAFMAAFVFAVVVVLVKNAVVVNKERFRELKNSL